MGLPLHWNIAMPYNPDIHHRRSIRLRNYDYSNTGAYFVTICVQNRECLFGDVVDGEMVLNDAGWMVTRWWDKLTDKFPMVTTDVSMVMPNHFHGIIFIVGADPCVHPDFDSMGAHAGAPLPQIVQWFKTMTTNEYLRGAKQHDWPPFPGRLWQRNYYEHVIRNDNDLSTIREYIAHNPAGWLDDENHPNAAPRPNNLS